jgi:hypothetical protein
LYIQKEDPKSSKNDGSTTAWKFTNRIEQSWRSGIVNIWLQLLD